ncbi:MAG: UDP-N-acetylglucosamine 1-carboxyvinyltransferase [Candidatus Paceibacterota bacterium]
MEEPKKEKFVIQGLDGKKTLSGSVQISGAKNVILPVMASSVLFKDGFTATNVPDIEDVEGMNKLLNQIGIETKTNGKNSYSFKTGKKFNTELNRDISKKMRASILLTGPILARCGEVYFPHPGGCVIGKRPIDLFVNGFKKMGAKIKNINGSYKIYTEKGKLNGTEIFFNLQSHTATETFLMAGVLAKGKTILKNCAMEPEIKNLTDFLCEHGAKIKGAGTSTIEIEGGDLLTDKKIKYETMPDRIETGSFLILGALAGKKLIIEKCNPSDLEAVINILRESEVQMKLFKNKIIIENKKSGNVFKNVNIKTHEYPGFPTDLQAPMSVFLTQASGESTIFETVFESRLNYTEDLIRMGANISVWNPYRAEVKGPTKLKGKKLESPDIRAGLAFVLASIIAEGESTINNVYYIDRGYENIEGKLSKIGVNIKRI